MNMTLRHHRVPANQLGEVTRRVDTDWIETMRRLQGFVSAYAVRLGEEQLTLMTAFVDETTAEKGKEATVAWVSQRLMDLDVEFQQAWEGPVVSHAGAD
jgi:hypothetical protein